ncbi:hypothetical protein [Chroococcidiopsis sp. CCNUC1]|uniref:hypothetical protein n=1 Tax=Chroococcidiopsis sp. CCNUC1 TaxID=2653189 RepID=UPI002020D6F4|nr:hypothetical protein [Chroococcidiopsis sp. CCNUC1]URD49933.1 hypothetical protein M5J74_26955 [Chroococcidiopsis sp. CCNUC1]
MNPSVQESEECNYNLFHAPRITHHSITNYQLPITTHFLPTHLKMLIGFIIAVLGLSSPLNYYQNNLSLPSNSQTIKPMNYSRSYSYSHSVASTYSQSSTQSSQQQTTGISLNATALRSPHILSVAIAGNTRLTGKVMVDGVEVKKLQASQTSFNLVPYLTKGDNKVEIVGEYRPVSSNVAIKLSGPGTQISQQVSGNGKLRQTLIITIR